MAGIAGRFRRVATEIGPEMARQLWMLWPTLDDAERAKHAARQGAWFALFVGVGTATVATLNLKGVSHNFLGLDAEASFLHAAVFLILGIFMFRFSRVAAILALALYVFERVGLFERAYQMAGPARGQSFLVILLGPLFVNAVRGTFAYRRLVHENPEAKIAN
jgi:hypothetical protein